MRVGFIGAGRMGRPMVGRLVETGHQVRVLHRTAGARSELTQLGATAVAEAVQAAEKADVVIVCVFTDEQVQEVCLNSELHAAMPDGSVLVIHTTGSPRTAETIAASAARHGVGVVDAPVSGGPHDIAAGQVTLFVGGADDDVAQARPALASYGDPILHVGPTGAGQLVKLVNNTLFAAQIGLVAEAVELGKRLGVEESTLLGALPHGSGTSRALSSIATRDSVASFIAMVGDFIGKDVAVVRKVVAELGSDLGRMDDIVSAGLDA
jgi:3-hydroxyisobutyrate dehydrogenase-like beta-hydroxyacid dehydrogenase